LYLLTVSTKRLGSQPTHFPG